MARHRGPLHIVGVLPIGDLAGVGIDDFGGGLVLLRPGGGAANRAALAVGQLELDEPEAVFEAVCV
jgi:hypothetical protein